MIYDIDFSKVCSLLLPPALRKEKIIAFLRCLTWPLQQVRNTIYNIYYPDIIERLKYNGQTIVLEGVLNKKYGITSSPLIYIENKILDTDGVYVAMETPASSYIPLKGYEEDFIGISYSLDNVNFIIHVPVLVSFVEAVLRALVDTYKLFGTNYTVQTY